MGKKSKKGDRSPSVERLRKKLKKIQEKLVMKDKDTSRSSSRDHDTFSLSSKETDTPRDIDLNPLLDEEDKENQNVNNLNLEVTELEKNDDDFVELDEKTLEILGEGLVSNEEEFAFHPKLAEAWKKVLAESIDKKSKIKLFKAYPRKGNCPFDTPKLNSEMEAIVNDTTKKRDKYLAIDQDLCGASLSSLGKAINMILNDKKAEIDRKELLISLIDSSKLMCELFKLLTKARKAFIYPGQQRCLRE